MCMVNPFLELALNFMGFFNLYFYLLTALSLGYGTWDL